MQFLPVRSWDFPAFLVCQELSRNICYPTLVLSLFVYFHASFLCRNIHEKMFCCTDRIYTVETQLKFDHAGVLHVLKCGLPLRDLMMYGTHHEIQSQYKQLVYMFT